jgi:hypothetical protein
MQRPLLQRQGGACQQRPGNRSASKIMARIVRAASNAMDCRRVRAAPRHIVLKLTSVLGGCSTVGGPGRTAVADIAPAAARPSSTDHREAQGKRQEPDQVGVPLPQPRT